MVHFKTHTPTMMTFFVLIVSLHSGDKFYPLENKGGNTTS